jgi:hypothetical protein
VKGSVIVVLAMVMACAKAISQDAVPMTDVSSVMEQQFSQLKSNYGKNKRVPVEFEKQFFMAISYFPELRDARIRVKLRKGSSGIISTRPTWSGLFRRSSKRSYVIFIGDSSGSRIPAFMFRSSPVNGQVGIIGHELTHILNFSRMNTFQLIGIGLGHLSTRYMDRFENKTDSLCIERGLGEQLIDWNIYLRKAFGMPDPENGPDPFFSDPGRERYMSPARIRDVMRRSEKYRSFR